MAIGPQGIDPEEEKRRLEAAARAQAGIANPGADGTIAPPSTKPKIAESNDPPAPVYDPQAELDKARAQQSDPNHGPAAKNAVNSSAITALEAQVALDKARGRQTDPGTVIAATAETPRTDRAGTVVNPVEVDRTARTVAPTAPGVVDATAARVAAPVSLEGLGARVAGSAAPAATAGAQQIDMQGRGLQGTAALAFQNMLTGAAPSVAENQLANAQGRAAAEQLSIAAGARGNGVVAARRNAAANIGGQQTEAAGQYAALRAKEIADAATGLAGVGGQIQGQELDKAKLNQEVELTNTKAWNDAKQAAQERFARGEITKAQLDTEVAKADAEFQQRTAEANLGKNKDIAMQHADQQLKADIASDDRLQQALNLRATLAQQAQAGNQQAATQLAQTDATLGAEIARFNATQIQTANGQNIENRLRAMGLDDNYVVNMTGLWQQAEAHHDTMQMEWLQTQLGIQARKAAEDKDRWGNILNAGSTIVGTMAMLSDRTAKKNIKDVAPADVDAFLRAVSKTRTWEYKDPANGAGTKTGPMAGDMRADKLAAEAVGERPDGKMSLDYQRLTALALAGVGRLNQRLEAIEGKRKPDEGGFLVAMRSKR